MKKMLMLALAATGSLLAAGTAQARVAWSIGIDVPGVATVVSSEPAYRAVPPGYAAPPVVYAPAPVYRAPPPAYYAPPPVYIAPPPVRYVPAPIVYEQPPRYYSPPPVIVEPGYRRGDWGWRHWHEERWEREHGNRDGNRDGRR